MLKLTNEQAILFSLLRGEEIPATGDMDWDHLISEAQAQAVFLMLQQPGSLPPEVAAKWSKLYYTSLRADVEAFYAVSEMVRVMTSIHQQYVILKGVSSASYYPDVFRRALGDVDFLIDTGHQAEVVKALEEAGYKAQAPTEHHIAFFKGKQDLEMHYAIPGVPEGEPGEIVRDYIKDILVNPVHVSINGTEVNIPEAKYHGLIILLHMQHHMVAGGIGLRHLIDWCYFVDKTWKEDFWATDLLPVMKKIGLFYYARVMTRIGADYLHTACPAWVGEIDESLTDAVMNDILTAGNFGRKDKTRLESNLLLKKYRNDKKQENRIYNLWQTLLGGVRGYHPEVVKKPVLYPVFILTFLLNRMKNVVTGKRAPLFKSARYVGERESVYDRLKLFEAE